MGESLFFVPPLTFYSMGSTMPVKYTRANGLTMPGVHGDLITQGPTLGQLHIPEGTTAH